MYLKESYTVIQLQLLYNYTIVNFANSLGNGIVTLQCPCLAKYGHGSDILNIYF